MIRTILRRIRGFCRADDGQVIPIAAVCIVGLFGMSALALDVGRALYTHRELQATTDAAALAGARLLTSSTAMQSDVFGSGAAVKSYSSSSGAIAHYSAVANAYNSRNSLPNVTVTSKPLCLATLQAQGEACIGNIPYNAVQVTQTSTIPTYFAGILGFHTWSLSATATASSRGGSPRPSNIAVIMDTTLSTLSWDSDCSNTELQCELNGMQVLLMSLQPCSMSQTACATSNVVQNAFDQVALFTFPAVAANTAYLDSSCTMAVPYSTYQNGYWNESPFGNFVMPTNFYTGASGIPSFGGLPTGVAYTFPTAGAGSYYVDPSTSNGTYQLLKFSADYKVSDSAANLNPYSALVRATGAGVSNSGANCPSMAPPNYDGVYGTYYAGALYAAQSALVAQQSLNPNSESVIVILSDGDATSGTQYDKYGNYAGPGSTWYGYPSMPSPATNSGSYPSYVAECGQAVVAAKAATNAGTLVYSVAYGSEPTGCRSDANAGSYPNISPCDTMAGMASAPQYFYSDWKQSGSGSTCISGQPVTALKDIFKAIANDLTETRLIPNDTQ